MKVEARRCKYKKVTSKYETDNVLDIIDIEDTLSKNKFIPKAPIDNFVFLSKPSIFNSHSITIINESEINYGNLNKNKFHINFNELQLEYPSGYTTPFIDSYFPIEVIGEGAFGLVISALNRKTKEKIAVKIIDKDNLERNFYIKEVEIVNKLSHSRILKIFEVLDTSKYFFIFMELIEGGSLKDMIIKRYYDKSKDYLFRDSECATIMNGVLEAIDYLHKNNIIHRDIKPENIMFKQKDNLNSVILCDFGMAYQLGKTEKFIQEKCGTLIYMAPEVMEDRKYDHLVDSFSAGIVLYILVSGGQHPIYKNGMTSNQYQSELLKKEKFSFSAGIPLLARNLFLKLCKHQAFFRYETYKALKHPWITRKANTQIPLTLIDEFEREDKIKSFKALLSSTMFLEVFKKKNNMTIKQKEEKVDKKEKIISKPKSPNTATASVLFKEMNIYFRKQDTKRIQLSKIKNIPKLRISNQKFNKTILKERFITTTLNMNTKTSENSSSIETSHVSNSPKNLSVIQSKRIFLKANDKTPLQQKTVYNSRKQMLRPIITTKNKNSSFERNAITTKNSIKGKKIFLKTSVNVFLKKN